MKTKAFLNEKLLRPVGSSLETKDLYFTMDYQKMIPSNKTRLTLSPIPSRQF